MTNPTYDNQMMRGTSRVRELVGTYLSNTIPSYIDTLRQQNNDLDEHYLPYPKQYLAADPYDTSTNDYPIVGTYFTGVTGFNTYEQYLMDGSTTFDLSYQSVIFVTVTTPYLGQDADNLPIYAEPNRAATIKVRDDIMAAMRASILGHPSFGTARQDRRIVADIGSMRETYPEPMKLNQTGNPMWVCSGLINLTIKSIESAVVPIIGTVEDVDLIVTVMED